jgi:hypothetical protein
MTHRFLGRPKENRGSAVHPIHLTENPWHRLPEKQPFVLPEDDSLVRTFNVNAQLVHYLRIEAILPEPFVGAKDAPVVLLSNNPGYGKNAAYRQDQIFMDRMRRNLLHEPSDYPFVFLAPDLPRPLGEWWRKKLKELLSRFGDEVIARSVLNIAYVPYASQRYRHGRLRLPSQDYSFKLVVDAMNRGAVIVAMRKKERWFGAIPVLEHYKHLYQVTNVQNPAISSRNCLAYQKVVQAVETADSKRR